MNKNKITSNKIINTVNLLLCLVLVFSVLSNVVFAYSNNTGWKGYAVYRDGVITVPGNSSGLNDHAALMDEESYNDYKPVLHAPGYGDVVEWGTWDEFLDGNSFLGVYRPMGTTITETEARGFVSKARQLRGISYTFLDQINYDPATAGTWVDSDEIFRLRCDGVVEYVYEWYGYRVGGADGRWDITRNRLENYWEHLGFNITPRKQNRSLLYKVQSSLPW